MNKKTVIKLKKAILYQGTVEQKRLLKNLKKQYVSLSTKDKDQLFLDLEKTFNHERESS